MGMSYKSLISSIFKYYGELKDSNKLKPVRILAEFAVTLHLNEK